MNIACISERVQFYENRLLELQLELRAAKTKSEKIYRGRSKFSSLAENFHMLHTLQLAAIHTAEAFNISSNFYRGYISGMGDLLGPGSNCTIGSLESLSALIQEALRKAMNREDELRAEIEECKSLLAYWRQQYAEAVAAQSEDLMNAARDALQAASESSGTV